MQRSRISRRHLMAASAIAVGAAGTPSIVIATAHPDAELLAMEAELDAACRRAENPAIEKEDKVVGAMLNIGHRILDMRAHTPEGMRLKLRVRGKMQIGDSSDDLILASIARDLGIADLDAAA